MEERSTLPLATLQHWMQQALLDPGQPLPGPLGAAPVEAVLNHSSRLSAREHLAIYQRSYVARLRSCMAQQFSALEYALGAELFQDFADGYLAAFPSGSYNLAELGRQFPAYLQASRPDALSELKEDWIDFIIELAAFEYAVGVLFDQKADENYQLARADDEEDDVELVPTGTLFRFQFPINTFYTQFKKGELPELPFAQVSYCVVLRHDYKLAVYALKPEHHAFLSLLATGLTVAQAKAAFRQRPGIDGDAFGRMWPTWKRNWLESNLLSRRKPR